jgi:iron complex outermembrane receptor protein
MKIVKLLFLLLLAVTAANAQQSGVRGTIKDATSGESVIGVNVLLSNGKGAVTDTSGRFFIAADSGSYTAQISALGFVTQTVKVTAGVRVKPLSISMESRTLTEVEIVANIAQTRETPIAFTNIDAKKIEEELASRDIPMLLTSTPGVYATMQGGGTGDSRVTIRGFNQQNIGVLVDGIPVNDMENSAVYWSNWDGLGDITRNIQIQRGLGASKLAVASVGGTINTITRGLEAKKGITYSQEYGSDMLLKETLSMTTGRMKGDWGITMSGTRKTGDGWVPQTPIQEWAYFIKAEKRFKNHLISAGANAAPQTHGQRTYQYAIGQYDKGVAAKLGVDTNRLTNASGTPKVPVIYGNYGTGYNAQWGALDRWTGTVDQWGVPTYTAHNQTNVNTAVNYFNKPLFNLSDYWNINDKLYLSTILYASYGTGGGTSMFATPSSLPNGQFNLQKVYDDNRTNVFGITTLAPGHRAANFIKSSINNHEWYGGLMTLNYKVNKNLTLTAGPDVRWYKGSHYYEVYDLLGADYFIDRGNQNINYTTNPSAQVKHVGDMFGHDYDSYVKYGGLFVQTEYVKEKLSAFITLTGVETGYSRVDNFLADTNKLKKSPQVWITGYSAKAGANYNLNENHNVYVNTGYMSKAQPFLNVFDNTNVAALNTDNQLISSVELGYGFKSKMIAANLNAYYTDWKNKPLDYPLSYTNPVTGDVGTYNLNGLNALHKGVELDFAVKPIKSVTIGGITSIASWLWNSSAVANSYDSQGNLLGTTTFDAKGVHVGNAAQSQYGLNVRYEPIKNLYFKIQWVYYGRNYAQFDPSSLNVNSPGYAKNPGGDHDSWRMPDYNLYDLHAGYRIRFYKHYQIDLAVHVINLFNTEYIADATDLGYMDATHATAFFGQGRRFLLSMKLTFN